MLSPLMTGKHSIWGTLNLISLRKNPSHQSLGHIIQKKDLDYLYSRLSSGHQSVLKARIDQKIGMNEIHIPVFFFLIMIWTPSSFKPRCHWPVVARCGPLWPSRFRTPIPSTPWLHLQGGRSSTPARLPWAMSMGNEFMVTR